MYRFFLMVGFALALTFTGLPIAEAQTVPNPGAKRVKPPEPGTKKRILVQIEPRENPAVLPPPEPRAAPDVPVADGEEPPQAPAGPLGRYAWFWDRVSPELSQSGPGRLDLAMQTIAGAVDPIYAPRLQHLQNSAKQHGVDILSKTIGTQISPALVLAMISVESSGKVDAVSSAGAAGLMQLMPATAERFGVTDRTEPAQNIAGGVAYLDWLMDEFEKDPILVLAGYNAGEGAVRNHLGVPPYAETRDYVPKVLAAFQVAKGLCKTPPELISDGCVFNIMN